MYAKLQGFGSSRVVLAQVSIVVSVVEADTYVLERLRSYRRSIFRVSRVSGKSPGLSMCSSRLKFVTSETK